MEKVPLNLSFNPNKTSVLYKYCSMKLIQVEYCDISLLLSSKLSKKESTRFLFSFVFAVVCFLRFVFLTSLVMKKIALSYIEEISLELLIVDKESSEHKD